MFYHQAFQRRRKEIIFLDGRNFVLNQGEVGMFAVERHFGVKTHYRRSDKIAD